jgi:hypothetical protein
MLCLSHILHFSGVLCIFLVTSCAMLSPVLYEFLFILLLLVSIFISLKQTTNISVNRTLSRRISPSPSQVSLKTSSHTARPPKCSTMQDIPIGQDIYAMPGISTSSMSGLGRTSPTASRKGKRMEPCPTLQGFDDSGMAGDRPVSEISVGGERAST